MPNIARGTMTNTKDEPSAESATKAATEAARQAVLSYASKLEDMTPIYFEEAITRFQREIEASIRAEARAPLEWLFTCCEIASSEEYIDLILSDFSEAFPDEYARLRTSFLGVMREGLES